MEDSRKENNRIELLKECFNEISGYFYLIEMNLLLLEYEYTAELLSDYHANDFNGEKEIIKH